MRKIINTLINNAKYLESITISEHKNKFTNVNEIDEDLIFFHMPNL